MCFINLKWFCILFVNGFKFCDEWEKLCEFLCCDLNFVLLECLVYINLFNLIVLVFI